MRARATSRHKERDGVVPLHVCSSGTAPDIQPRLSLRPLVLWDPGSHPLMQKLASEGCVRR